MIGIDSMATNDAGQGISSIIAPDDIIKIVQTGPVAVFMLMFVVTSYLFIQIKDKDKGIYYFVGAFYIFSLTVCGFVYFISSSAEKIPTAAEVRQQFKSVSAEFRKQSASNVAVINLGLRDWSTIFQARILVRQSLRALCVAKDSECGRDFGIQQYAKRMFARELIDQNMLNRIMKFSQATFYVEWFDGHPNNNEIADALDDAPKIIDELDAMHNF